MKLSDILKEVETTSIQGPVDRVIHALRYDSRRVEADDVFFAWKGAKTDGHQYIAEVCDKGAVAVVLENPVFAAIAKQVAQIMNIPPDLPAPVPAAPSPALSSNTTPAAL